MLSGSKAVNEDQCNLPFSASCKRTKFLLLNRRARSESEQEVGMQVQSKRSPQPGLGLDVE